MRAAFTAPGANREACAASVHIPAAHVLLMLTKDANSSGKVGGVEGLDSVEVDVWVSEGSLGRGWDDRRFVGRVTPRL